MFQTGHVAVEMLNHLNIACSQVISPGAHKPEQICANLAAVCLDIFVR
jgi:hypothetical protein